MLFEKQRFIKALFRRTKAFFHGCIPMAAMVHLCVNTFITTHIYRFCGEHLCTLSYTFSPVSVVVHSRAHRAPRLKNAERVIIRDQCFFYAWAATMKHQSSAAHQAGSLISKWDGIYQQTLPIVLFLCSKFSKSHITRCRKRYFILVYSTFSVKFILRLRSCTNRLCLVSWPPGCDGSHFSIDLQAVCWTYMAVYLRASALHSTCHVKTGALLLWVRFAVN